MARLERRFFVLRWARAAAALLASSSLSSCFVTISDPAVESTGGAPSAGGSPSSGGAQSSGASGGGHGGGGRGGADAGSDGNSCGTCSLPNVKAHGCRAGACTITECADGFVDCDGDPTNGCETDFHVEAGDGAVRDRAPSLGTSGAIDGTFAEWHGFPLFPMAEPCTLCQADQPGGQPGPRILGRAAGPADLTAVFATGWDSGGLYLYAQVRDDQIVALDPTDVEKQDGVELLLDGDTNDTDTNYGPDVHHLFVGVLAPKGSNFSERNQPPPTDDVTVATAVEPQCYFVEMRLSWPYVMGKKPYVPKVGDVHGLSVATNDWDVAPGAEAGAAPARETQLFSVVPNPNYTFNTTGFGTLTLE